MIIILYIGCEKREVNSVQHYTNNSDPILVTSLVASQFEEPVHTTCVVNSTVGDKTETLQEIIKNYPATLPENNAYQITYEFQIEGNFTGSGNRELFAFYRRLGGSKPSINFFYCFVYDSSGEEIEKIYQLSFYGTSLLTKKDEEEAGLTEVLGRPIIWRDRIIGYAGDFNENGKEELYIYAISGISKKPEIFEFDGTEFISLLDLDIGPMNTVITDINPEEKIITLRIVLSWDGPDIHLVERTNAYIWDMVAQRYEILSSEDKFYRWNRNLQQYDEVEG
jgi:hypothetical protein